MKKFRKLILVLTVLAVLASALTGCGKKDDGQKYFSMEDLQGPGKVFSLWQGCGYEDYLTEYFPEAIPEYGEYVADLGLKVRQGKSDAMIIGQSFFNHFHDELKDMVILDGDLGTIQGALIFSDGAMGSYLRSQFNDYLETAASDGTLDELKSKWLDLNDIDGSIDFSKLDPSCEHIRVAVTNDEPPYTFTEGGELRGYDAELIVRFCEYAGFYPDFEYDVYEAMIIAVQMDQYDIIAAGYELVEERKESVSFGDPSREDRIIVAVKGEEQKLSFAESVKKSFRRTFIDDNRYLEFLKGLGTTMTIVVSSIVIGFILGFLIYFFNRDCGKFAKVVLRFLSIIIHRVPSIVLLMVLYYVIFGNVNISAVIVSIILFSISFAFMTFESLELAVNSIGKGQSEAAFTLGLTTNESFFNILLPQGRVIFISGIKDAIVSTMLESSVVGFIAVVDLTRVGDIIRNNTYEAFFPLIAVALFYLALSSIVIALINHIEKQSDPMSRSSDDILKSIMKTEE